MYIEVSFFNHFDCIWIPKLAGWTCGRSLKGYFENSSPEQNLDQTNKRSIRHSAMSIYKLNQFFFYLFTFRKFIFAENLLEAIDFHISEFGKKARRLTDMFPRSFGAVWSQLSRNVMKSSQDVMAVGWTSKLKPSCQSNCPCPPPTKKATQKSKSPKMQ